MRVATKARAVAKTDMNARSSRSHSVFTLHVTGINASQGVEIKGQLNLCDLAGSERLSKSGATGERLKETQAINKSLAALGDIFQSLAQKSAHIPYRNSKLTHLLQPCFSGKGKSLMIANMSPAASSHDETLCSLRFASKVNACELGKNKQTKNVKAIGGAEDAKPSKRARTAPSSTTRK
jgi:kinesin family protein C1